MTINNLVNNSDLNLEAHILIQSYNDETGEVKEVYNSWDWEKYQHSHDCTHEIGNKEITYATVISGVNFPYLLIEFQED